MQIAQELNPKTSPLVDEAWAGVLEALLCRQAVFSVEVSQLQLSTTLAVSVPESEKKNNPRSKGYRKSTSTINKTKTFAELVARHIPPSILREDVAAFTRWLARPDRPNLVRGRSLQFVFAGEGEDNIGGGTKGEEPSSATTTSSPSSRHRAALLSLSLLAPTIAETQADYAFLPAAADATTGRLLPWSSVTEIGELYRVRPTLLPPSLAVMMHSSAVIGFLHSPESSTRPLVKTVAMDKKKEEAGGLWKDEENDHLSQDVAFRKTITALGRMKRRETAILKARKKLWALPPSAAAAAAAVMGNQHQQGKGAALPVSSMGASDDVVVRLRS